MNTKRHNKRKRAGGVNVFKKLHSGKSAATQLRLYIFAEYFERLQHEPNTNFRKTNLAVIIEDFQRKWLQHIHRSKTDYKWTHKNTSRWGDKVLDIRRNKGGLKNYFSF
jgi:hypothetical protein